MRTPQCMWSLTVLLALPTLLSAQRQVDRKFAIDSDASIRITTAAGSMRVIGWDRDTIWISGTVPSGGALYAGGSGQGAKMGVEPFTDVAGLQDTDLEVRVPRTARVWLKTISAAVEIVGLEGEVDLTGVTSSLTVIGDPRVLTAETMDGTIRVDGGGGGRPGVIRVRTGSGAIELLAGVGSGAGQPGKAEGGGGEAK